MNTVPEAGDAQACPALSDRQRRMLRALYGGSTTLAGLRAALPAEDPHAIALPSMGEPDPFGEELTDLIVRGWVADDDGWYSLAETDATVGLDVDDSPA